MPPGPLYNWFCVLHGAAEVLSHAASLRATQAGLSNTGRHTYPGSQLRVGRTVPSQPRREIEDVEAQASKEVKADARPKQTEKSVEQTVAEKAEEKTYLRASAISDSKLENNYKSHPAQFTRQLNQVEGLNAPLHLGSSSTTSTGAKTKEHLAACVPQAHSIPDIEEANRAEKPGISHRAENPGISGETLQRTEPYQGNESAEKKLQREESIPLGTTESSLPQEQAEELSDPVTPPDSSVPRQRNLQPSRVPSSRLGRLFHYGGLAASLGYGMASEALRRTTTSTQEGDNAQTPLMLTSSNVSRLVEKLSKMRGAALKLGQFMSIQDSHLLPKDVEEIFRRVQDSAHYMPNWQMERVMADSLGPDWESHFSSFERVPFAAASLGQVHAGVLAAHASPTGQEARVAIKIQFPDIARSIESDLGYLKILLGAGRVLPRGLFLDKTLQVMKGELVDECDYRREATCAQFFGSEEGLVADKRFRVPWVWEGSTERVLVMEHMDGVSVGGEVVDTLSQSSRDQIATSILELCMKELFVFRKMQTDPNWSNFLWDEKTQQIELIDFGATRSYSKAFIDNWMHLLQAAVAEDRDACIHWSLSLGYLTGAESETMLDAHVRSLTLLATPFRARRAHDASGGQGVSVDSTDGRYVFGRETEWASITKEIRSLIPVMLRERLTPPPRETYSLNRKLSGAFLLASRLGARVDCHQIWEETARSYEFSQPEEAPKDSL